MTLLIYFINTDTKVVPVMMSWPIASVCICAALIMGNDISLMAIMDVIKAVCEYSPLRSQ